MLRQKARAISAGVVASVVGAALAAALLVGPATSSAAKAPASFYGVASQTPLTTPDYQRMGTGKVGSQRIIVNWATVDPTSAAGDSNWSSVDPIVYDAANNGVDILPFLYGTPEWAAKGLDHQKCKGSKCVIYAPKTKAGLAAWETFVGEFVDRYGENGTFWNEHPEVPKNPIDEVQIWNEQNSPKYFAPKVNVARYAALLKEAAAGIRSVDADAEIVLGGMWGPNDAYQVVTTTKDYLTKLFKLGADKDFDSVAIHPYANNATRSVAQLVSARRLLVKHHDSHAGMWVTEVGWAARGPRDNPYVKGLDGQARTLTRALSEYKRRARSLNLRGVFWYSWRDLKGGDAICDWCGHAGLRTKSGEAKPAWDAFVKVARG